MVILSFWSPSSSSGSGEAEKESWGAGEDSQKSLGKYDHDEYCVEGHDEDFDEGDDDFGDTDFNDDDYHDQNMRIKVIMITCHNDNVDKDYDDDN